MFLENLPEAAAILPGHVRVSGRILFENPDWEPEVLWFDIPESYRADLSDSGNFWLAALLPLAFRLGEPLRLALPVDVALSRNAEEMMLVWSRWFRPTEPVALEVQIRPQPARPLPAKTGLFFTGGVDSFFSLLHFDEVAKTRESFGLQPVQDLIYVWGYDIPLENPQAFHGKAQSLSTVAQALGKNLVTVVTNLRQTRLRAYDWGPFVHGPALAAAGLLLEKRFSRLLLSSSLTYDDLDPWGSHALLDPLFSTTQTHFQHYGAGFDRFQKTAFCACSDVALRHLHVCWRDATDQNCGKCEKCYRTQLTLDIVGGLERATSFPPGTYSLERMREVWEDHPLVIRLYKQLREHALKSNRPDVVQMIDHCLAVRPETPSRWRRRADKLGRGFRKLLAKGAMPPSG